MGTVWEAELRKESEKPEGPKSKKKGSNQHQCLGATDSVSKAESLRGHQRGLDSTLGARDASKECTLLTPALQTAKEQTLQEQKWNEAALRQWQGSHGRSTHS